MKGLVAQARGPSTAKKIKHQQLSVVKKEQFFLGEELSASIDVSNVRMIECRNSK